MNKIKIIIGIKESNFSRSYLKGAEKINQKDTFLDSLGAKVSFLFTNTKQRSPLKGSFLKDMSLDERIYSLTYNVKKNKKLELKEKLEELNNYNEIEFAEEDYKIKHFYFEEKINSKNNFIQSNYPYGTINFNPLKPSIKNTKITVAVLDTGINYKHEFLKDSLWSDKNNSYGFNFTKNDTNVIDFNGHGSLVSGIIAANSTDKKLIGISNSVKILSCKVIPSKEKNYVSNIIKAFEYALCNGAEVINNSWRIEKPTVEYSLAIDRILNKLEIHNCIPVFAAGNDGIDIEKIYPQNKNNVIVVGAIDKDSNILGGKEPSNYGEKVTVWAPGEKIYSTFRINFNNTNTITYGSGTSMAAPFVTGTVALLKQLNKDITVYQIKKTLKKNSTKLNLSKPNKSGLLDINKSITNINFLKSNLMSKKQTSKQIIIPESQSDINSSIFLFLHLEEDNIFQLLHNETDTMGKNSFQIYGRFRGEKVVNANNVEKFNLSEVDLKLVNLIENDPEKFQISKKRTELIYNNEKEQVDFKISIEPVNEQISGIDMTLKQHFTFEKNVTIDIHISKFPDPVTKNGVPCNMKAYFK